MMFSSVFVERNCSFPCPVLRAWLKDFTPILEIRYFSFAALLSSVLCHVKAWQHDASIHVATGLDPSGSIIAMMHQDISLCFICVLLDRIVGGEILMEMKLC